MALNRFYVCLSLLALCLPVAQAEKVYRSVDETGAVEFSDQDHHGSEEIKLQKVPTYNFKVPKTPKPSTAQVKKEQAVAPPIQIHIISPADKETIRNNQGDVTLVLDITGAEREAVVTGQEAKILHEGEKIVAILDGQMFSEADKTTIVLHNVDRGTHQLKAQLLNAEGKTLAESPSVEFYMKRLSKLFKKPKKPIETK